jgi:hypothetical protein
MAVIINRTSQISDINPKAQEFDFDAALNNVSFSGTDIVATMILPPMGEGKSSGDYLELGDLQTVSYSIHRENSPVRTIGHSNVRGFVKGSRTIAGSLIFTVFNEYAWYKIDEYKNYLSRTNGFFAPLADMLPPFDIVFTFFNEYGNASKMKIYGVTIVDEGQTMSIDDILTEQTYTFMARGIQPITKMINEKEMTKLGDIEAQRAAQRNRNIFGDSTEEGLPITTIYSNFIEEIYRV